MPTLRAILAIPVGLLAGGLATMLADRVLSDTPLGLRSRCPACGASLSFAETLPVLTRFRLGGSCRGCGVSVTGGDPIAEAVHQSAQDSSPWAHNPWKHLERLRVLTVVYICIH